LAYTPPDTRIILLIIGYSFGALLEGKKMKRFHVVQILKFCKKKKKGVAGFGTPGAICSSLMVSVG
jgi:lactate permease